MAAFDTHALPTSPSLISILLITKTRAGPRLLLHYPPSPDKRISATSRPNSASVTNSDADPHSSSSDSSEVDSSHELGTILRGRRAEGPRSRSASATSSLWSSSLKDRDQRRRRRKSGLARGQISDDEAGQAFALSSDEDVSEDEGADSAGGDRDKITTKSNQVDRRSDSKTGSKTPSERARWSWDLVLGHSLSGLAKLLAPTSRSWHKKKFEICLGGRCYLGCPVFEKQEGGWGKKRRRRKKPKKRTDTTDVQGQYGMAKVRDENGIELEFNADDDGEGEDDDQDNTESEDDKEYGVSEPDQRHAAENSTRDVSLGSEYQSQIHIPIPNSTSLTSSGSDPMSLPSTNGDTPLPETLTMFNVVLVLSPPQLEHQTHVKAMYTHVLKKLVAALKERQKKSDYVWAEMRKIIQIREKARNEGAYYIQTLPLILQASTLATALAETYNSISRSNIAHLTLDSNVQLSLQIPQPFSTPYLPTSGNRHISNLWLTTFDPFQLDDEVSPQTDNNATGGISPHSALLLLSPPTTLLKEIASATYMAPVLAKALTLYIQHTTPTKSLLQLSKKLRLSLPDLQLLSLHLIHWRRARPTFPLHPNHIYIVSPLADFRTLDPASAAFAARFHALPSLVALLGKLSSTAGKGPIAWGTLVPSPDHKPVYMEILEWLVRDGWVTQLRTFAWVVISREVKMEVARRTQREARERRHAAALATPTVEEEQEEDEYSDNEQLERNRTLSNDFRANRRQSSVGSAMLSSTLLSPRPRGTPHSSSGRRTSIDSGAGSASSTLTAVRMPLGSVRGKPDVSPLRSTRDSSAASISHPRHRLSSSSVSVQSRIPYDPESSLNFNLHEPADAPLDLSDFHPSIVISPHKANALESRWLQVAGEMLPDNGDREAWPKLLKYFDGRHALEEVALREGMKRKGVNPMLGRLVEGGVLRVVRHW